MTRLLSTPVLALLLALLAAAVYWPGLSGSFLFDDFPNIVTNDRVHLDALDTASLEKAAKGYQPGQIGRPLATLSFALNYYAGGKVAWGYKLTNVLLHACTALLVFALLVRLFRIPSSGTWPRMAAFTIALLWAIHPLQVSTVLYVVQRMEMLAATFVLLGLLAYLRGRMAQIEGRRGWPWLGLSAALAGIGLLSKETAVLFPLYTLALELTVLRFKAIKPGTTRFLKYAYGIGLAAGLLVFIFLVIPRYATAEAFAGRDFTLHERLLSQLRILPMYLGQMLLPLPGSMPFYYDAWPKSTGWLSPPSTLAGALFLVGLVAVAWRLRGRMQLFSLGIFWFLASHVLTSNVINLELVFEHRNYLALLGILLSLADLIRRIPLRDGPQLMYVAVAAIILGFGGLTVIRSAIWGNPLQLAMDLVAKSPDSPRASSDLATLYVGMSDSDPNSPFFDLGRREFERGRHLPNASPLPEQGLILMAATTGLPVDDDWWQSLIHKVKTRPVSPQETMAVTGLMDQRYKGIALDDQRLSQAYAALLARGSMPAQLYAQYGDYALNYLHDGDLASRMFVKAIEQAPKDADYANKIIGVLVADGHGPQAEAVIARAKALGLFKGIEQSPSAPDSSP